MDILRVDVDIQDRRVRALIDSGSEINVMARAMCDYLGLEARPSPRMTIVTQTRDSAICIGCCIDVGVSIGDIIVHTPIFVVSSGDEELILGRPWQHAAMIRQETCEDGDVLCAIFSPDRKRKITFRAFLMTDGKTRCETDIWPLKAVPGTLTSAGIPQRESRL